MTNTWSCSNTEVLRSWSSSLIIHHHCNKTHETHNESLCFGWVQQSTTSYFWRMHWWRSLRLSFPFLSRWQNQLTADTRSLVQKCLSLKLLRSSLVPEASVWEVGLLEGCCVECVRIFLCPCIFSWSCLHKLCIVPLRCSWTSDN